MYNLSARRDCVGLNLKLLQSSCHSKMFAQSRMLRASHRKVKGCRSMPARNRVLRIFTGVLCSVEGKYNRLFHKGIICAPRKPETRYGILKSGTG